MDGNHAAQYMYATLVISDKQVNQETIRRKDEFKGKFKGENKLIIKDLIWT